MNFDRSSDTPVAKRRRLGDEHVGPPSEGARETSYGSYLVPPRPDSSNSSYTQAWHENALTPFSNCQRQSRQAKSEAGMAVTYPNSRDGSIAGINNFAAPNQLLPQHGTSWEYGYPTTSTQFGHCQSASQFSLASGFDQNGMADQQKNTAWLAFPWGQMGVAQPLHVMYSNSAMMSGAIEPSVDPRELDLMHHKTHASRHEVSGPSGAYLTCPPQPVQILNAESPVQERPEVESVCFGMVRDLNNTQEMYCELD